MGKIHELKMGPGQLTPYGKQFFAPVRAMTLIKKAKLFLEEPDADPSIAAILAQTACEVVFEGYIAVKMRKSELAELEKFVDSLRITYTTTNETAGKLYYTLTGDDSLRTKKKDSLSERLQETAKLRHKVVHKGGAASSDEAMKSIQTAEEFVIYLLEKGEHAIKVVALPEES